MYSLNWLMPCIKLEQKFAWKGLILVCEFFNICNALSIYNTECKLKWIIFSVHQVISQQTSVNRMHARALFCISMGEFVSLSNCFCLLAYYCIPWVYHYANCHCTVNINQLMKQNRYSVFSFQTNTNTTIRAFWKCFPPWSSPLIHIIRFDDQTCIYKYRNMF